jgi:iron-sulfur cluster repair protein YtfE (RIC family)
MSVMNTLKKTMSGEQPDDPANDILATLKQDHRDVAEMLEKLVESHGAVERKNLLASIREALVPHLRAEEKVVYDAVRGQRGKEQKTHAEEGYLEHGLADKTLTQLGKMSDTLSPEFSAGAKVLKELVEHHVEEEETDIWADVKEHFSDHDRVEMNRKFLAAKKRVKVPA